MDGLTFHSVGNVIIPTDFHIFQRGGSTTNQLYLNIFDVGPCLWSDRSERTLHHGMGQTWALHQLMRPQVVNMDQCGQRLQVSPCESHE